jgi:response regulator RpfG family c-di-GMP phosphodiesterase
MTAPATPRREVLVVEDEPEVRALLDELFQSLGYVCHLAVNGQEGLDAFTRERPPLTVTDMRMPVMDGMELVTRIRAADADAGIMVLTAHGDVKMAVKCLKMGADDFLTKPFDLEEIAIAAERVLERRQMLLERRQSQALVEQRVAEATHDLSLMLREVEEAHSGMLQVLGALFDARNAETPGHCTRLLEYSLAIARAHGVPDEERAAIEQGVLLHDIGKLAIPESVLLKPGPLTPEERDLINTHPDVGRQLLERIPALRQAVPIVYHHHERWDGSGYPLGLWGEAIPIAARIFAVAEAFEVMTVDRPYARAVATEAARQEIATRGGSAFDPAVVASFLAVPAETLDEIRRRVPPELAPPGLLALSR